MEVFPSGSVSEPPCCKSTGIQSGLTALSMVSLRVFADSLYSPLSISLNPELMLVVAGNMRLHHSPSLPH